MNQADLKIKRFDQAIGDSQLVDSKDQGSYIHLDSNDE